MFILDLFFYTFYNHITLFLISLVYLIYILLNSKSFFKLILTATLILIWSSLILFYNQLELFATLILLAEIVVFIYLFVIVIIGNISYLQPQKNNIFYLFCLLGLVSINHHTTFFNYILINWYVLLLDSTDVYLIMSSFYEYNPLIIVNIGIIITILTFVVGNIVVLYYYSFTILSYTIISLKSQKKKRQILKKPTTHVFSKTFNNDF
jgi:hypothetical protein